jgi:hypothetical protein
MIKTGPLPEGQAPSGAVRADFAVCLHCVAALSQQYQVDMEFDHVES